ncbi:ABC transporter permease [Chordicoccus furentiruminis]|uniref:ABC transporter permease n=1 Tax=Chordicoccus furentiruminis TaxID=2709410 RepID=UPI0023A855B4|nr:ABC transporter permease [Chordicoccus furentiruminis]
MTKTKKIAGMLGIPYIAWAAVFIIVPLLMVFWYGLTDASGHFTLANVAAIAEPAHSKSLLMALLLSLIATGVCLLLAYPLSMFLVETQKTTHSFLAMLLIVPMWMNFLLRTYAWQSILEKTGIINTALTALGLRPLRMINTPGAIVLGMVYNFLPFMILPIYNSLEKIDGNVINAARDLGASQRQTLNRIIIPLSMPGVISGITMVFIPALTTFVVSSLLGGGKILLIGNVIEEEFMVAYDWNLGAGLSLVLLVFIIISVVISAVTEKDEEVSR